jgi:hypothetical protein
MKARLESWKVMTGLIMIATVFSIFFSCVSEEKADPCSDTKWVETKEPLVYVKVELKQFTIDNQYNSQAAEEAKIWVDITKYYCPDKKSTMFTQEERFFPKDCEPQYLDQGFYLDQPYLFKFGNDLDYLELEYQLLLYFPKVYTWTGLITLYYQDLIYDYTLNSYYIPLVIDDWSE